MNARKCGFAMCAVSIAAEFAWAQAGEGSSRYLTNQPGFWLPQQYRGEHGGGADPARERAARGAVRWWGQSGVLRPHAAAQLLTLTSVTRCAEFRGGRLVSTSRNTYAGGCAAHAQMWQELNWQKLADLLVR